MRALLPAALLLALALAGCTGNAPGATGTPTQPLDQGNAPGTAAGTSSAPTGGSHDHAVAIADFSFSPSQLTIAVGDSVTWTNGGSHDHTVTDGDANGFDSGTIHPGATFHQAFAKPGVYSYHCAIHSSMTATITVQ